MRFDHQTKMADMTSVPPPRIFEPFSARVKHLEKIRIRTINTSTSVDI
jgi:hypothetical protein